MVGMRIEGLAELARTLNSLPQRTSRRVQQEALLDAGEPMRAGISSRAPREPGAPDLADNINLAPLRKQAGSEDVSVGIGPSSRFFFYDTMQEFGTSRHGAQPFYRPAFDAEAERVIKTVADRMWTALASKGIHRPTMPGGSITGGPGGGGLL